MHIFPLPPWIQCRKSPGVGEADLGDLAVFPEIGSWSLEALAIAGTSASVHLLRCSFGGPREHCVLAPCGG